MSRRSADPSVPDPDPIPAGLPSAFKSAEGRAAYLAVYDEAMKAWPVPFEEMKVSSRFGLTHVVVSGPKAAPPLVLLHGYMASLTMWSPNVAEFCKDHRVYAIDIVGQPGRSIPDESIRSAADYLEWLTATLDGLRLGRVSVVGMSYGGWLALKFAVVKPDRVRKLVLLSPAASFLPVATQFRQRGMLMALVPTRLTVNSFMRWLGFQTDSGAVPGRPATLDLMYLGLKHFRLRRETLQIEIDVFSDAELRALQVPVLLLLGEREVIYDPAAALARALRLLPHVQGELIPQCGHDLCVRQHRMVNARVGDFLKDEQRLPHGVVA